ncbi:MAG TPA: hypothetical protein VG963_12480 [Polyangiaceae bacterium]|nr:hypothetical protein [Polyangiaceae bacterium]
MLIFALAQTLFDDLTRALFVRAPEPWHQRHSFMCHIDYVCNTQA